MSAWEAALTGFAAHLSAPPRPRAAATVESYCKHVGWLAADVAKPAAPLRVWEAKSARQVPISRPGLTRHGDPWEVTPSQLSAWLDGHEWSPHTRRKVLVSLRAFYGWGIHEGLCQRSPLAGLSAVPPRKRGPNRLQPAPAWVEPISAYLTWLQSGARRPGTVEQRRWWLTRLGETYADPWTLTATDLALWLSRGDWAPETKRAARASVRTFYRWAELVGRVDVSPARDLDSVLLPRTLPRPAPDDAVREALSGADDRTRLAIMLAIYTGLRRSELAGLHTRDIGDVVLRVCGKGGDERLVPLHPDLAAALRTELRRRREGISGTGWGRVCPKPDGWLFPSDDPAKHLTPGHLGQLIARALPGDWTTHSCRHRFASQAYAAGRDLRAVQSLLGHSKPETTARYAAVPDGALQAAVAGVGLRG